MNDLALRVQSQLTGRDRVLLGWLYDHGVGTSFQLANALFFVVGLRSAAVADPVPAGRTRCRPHCQPGRAAGWLACRLVVLAYEVR